MKITKKIYLKGLCLLFSRSQYLVCFRLSLFFQAKSKGRKKNRIPNKQIAFNNGYSCDGTFSGINLAWNRFGLLFRNHMKWYKGIRYWVFLSSSTSSDFPSFYLKIYLISEAITYKTISVTQWRRMSAWSEVA